MYNNLGLDPLPSYEEPVPSPLSTPELCEEYPLVLTTGARLWGMFHSEHRQIPRMRALHPEPLVYVNPKTAADFGVKDGDWVWVENHRGRCKRVVKETPIVNERTASTDHAWWHPEAPGELEAGLYDLWDLTVENLFALRLRQDRVRRELQEHEFARSTAWRKESSDGLRRDCSSIMNGARAATPARSPAR